MPRKRLSSLFKRGPAMMEDLRSALAPVLVERGRDPSVLLIAFTGGAEKLMLPVYEFFDTTKSLGYSRILLVDRFHHHYDRGIDNQRPDFPSLVGYLREEIERLSPTKVLCIGTSSGAYAAIRAGHQLRADYVHAFAPQTAMRPNSRGAPNGRFRFRPWKGGLQGRAGAQAMDLAQVLKDWNQKTTYYVHYCRGCDADRYHAERLFRSPGVVNIGYPCDTHLVAVFLAKKGFLTEALAIANQDQLVEIAKAHFCDALDVSEPRSDGAGSHPE